jgi:chorismate dehydratase
VDKSRRIRVSFIEFLNSVPLGWAFLQGLHRADFDVKLALPSECADDLADRKADVGLIPAIEYQRIPGLRILPDLSISARREARTVLFASRVPLPRVERVAVDTSSRTSVVLLRVILEKFLGRRNIVYQPHEPDPERMLSRFDGALIIGNPAFRVPRDRFLLHDLAGEWHRFTGLPFVFALWAVRQGFDLGETAAWFALSREAGLRSVPTIAETYADRLGLSRDLISSYLLDSLDYSLDEIHLRALDLFFGYARELGVLSSVKPVRFYGPIPAPTRRPI